MNLITPTHQELDLRWERAQQFESNRDIASARSEYRAILVLDAHHVPALLRLSRHAQRDGDFHMARSYVMRASDSVRFANRYRQISFVSLRLLDFAEDAEVASVILTADWNNPHVLNQSPMLAQHLWLAGRYEDALRFIGHALPRVPPNALLHYARANVFRFLGRLDDAREAYEATLEINPELADAHWSLATLGRARSPLERVDRIRRAQSAHGATSEEQAHLYYALFHELDAAGDVEHAWAALGEGAAIMAQKFRYDPEAERRQIEGLMDGDPLPPAEGKSVPGMPIPVFVVGMPRTGTTLLDRMLGNIPGVSSAGERNDLSMAVSEVSNSFFGTLLEERETRPLSRIDMQRAGLRYLQRLRQVEPQAVFVIDKNPRNLFSIPLIARALPQARILCLSRNGRDACFSGFKELFHGASYPYSYRLDHLAAHWKLAQSWMRHWHARLPGMVKIVEYEALAVDPGATLECVQDFIGLPRNAAFADITTNVAPVSTASSAQVREPVHQRGVGAWRRYAPWLSPIFDSLGLPE
ncbi:sulfotransferase [Pseudoxanthomonas helianthi]|uniref:Sulfotransferase n=1 Tax=Pseudoxanthomonas helianthi TaxID=1453541 RepID=A0A941ARN8_9GAMM|nr:sulfotransferase [Pseudoxanthomonas helianthi]MBP3983071.1 sulfotransferase [Pseudoxanthomonas helianthi]